MSPVQIRFAERQEVGALEALMRESSLVWEEQRADLLAHPEVIEVPEAAVLARQVRAAVEHHRIVGFSVVVPVDDQVCELDGLFVAPDVMRRGIGRQLVRDLASRARAEGRSCIQVVANPRALGFYERVGFEATGPAQTRFGPAVRMRAVLADAPGP